MLLCLLLVKRCGKLLNLRNGWQIYLLMKQRDMILDSGITRKYIMESFIKTFVLDKISLCKIFIFFAYQMDDISVCSEKKSFSCESHFFWRFFKILWDFASTFCAFLSNQYFFFKVINLTQQYYCIITVSIIPRWLIFFLILF